MSDQAPYTPDPGPAQRAAKKTEVTNRRRKAVALHLARVSMTEIAARLGVSVSLISRDLKKVNEKWEQEYLHDANRLKFRECAALDSDEARVRARLASVPDVPALQGVTDAESRQQHAQVWDSVSRTYCRLQETAIKIMQQRAKLLGLEAPVKIETSGAQALRVEFVNDWTPVASVEITEVHSANGKNGHAEIEGSPSENPVH